MHRNSRAQQLGPFCGAYTRSRLRVSGGCTEDRIRLAIGLIYKWALCSVLFKGFRLLIAITGSLCAFWAFWYAQNWHPAVSYIIRLDLAANDYISNLALALQLFLTRNYCFKYWIRFFVICFRILLPCKVRSVFAKVSGQLYFLSWPSSEFKQY